MLSTGPPVRVPAGDAPAAEKGGFPRCTAALLVLAMVGLIGALSINLNAPFFGSFETQAAFQTLPARNHLRYGLTVTKGMASLAPAGLEGEDLARHWWINHPPLAPWGTTLFFALFGESTAAARLSGFSWTVLTLPLLWLVARKLESEAAGWWAILVYASAGLTLWDARRPEYFQPALFFMMLSLAFYLLWLERPTASRWGVFLAGIVLGCWVDWMGYFYGAALALHLGLSGKRRWWRRAVVLLGILPLCFLLILLHVRLVVGHGSWGTLASTFIQRATGASRLAATAVMVQACVTHVGLATVLGAIAAFALPGGMAPLSRVLLWTLAGYGLASSQMFLSWTNYHAYVAAWFLFPALVLSAGIGLARFLVRVPKRSLRIVCMVAVGAAIASQGMAFAVYRHRQDGWYGPDREVIRVLKASVPAQSWVATPLKGLSMTIETYETDCNIFWDVTNAAALRPILARGRPLYLLIPRPDAPGGFWENLSPATRERLGVRSMAPDCGTYLEVASRRGLGAYELCLLKPRR